MNYPGALITLLSLKLAVRISLPFYVPLGRQPVGR
jgi:hypothetical protein